MKKLFLSSLFFALCISYTFSQLYVDSEGDVGIENNAPSEKLDIKKNAMVFAEIQTTMNQQHAGVKLVGEHSGTVATSRIYMNYYGGSGISHGLNYQSGRSGFAHHWFKDNGGGVLMVIKDNYSSALVGIARTDPSYNLDVDGNIRCTGTLTQSDERLKENILSLKDEPKSLLNLSPISYNFIKPADFEDRYSEVADTIKNDPEFIDAKQREERKYTKTRYGFSAQALQQVYPELVDEDKDGVLCVDYVGLIPIMVGYLKEQQATIDELKAKVDALLEEKEKLALNE